MNQRVRVAVGLAVALLLAGVGTHTWARYAMEDRILGYGPAIGRLPYARGGRIPTQDEFTAQARSTAEGLGLEVVSLAVTRSEETGLDGTGQLAQDRIGGVGQLRMRLVRYEVTTTVIARQWFLSRSGELVVDQTYRQEVTLETPNARPAPSRPVIDEPPMHRGF